MSSGKSVHGSQQHNDDSHEIAQETLIVLESFRPPGVRTNPYLIRLFDSLPPQIHPRHFSWRGALFEPFDVFHLHWPEHLVRGSSPLRTVFRCCAFFLLLLRIRLSRAALVRTLHNQIPHEPGNLIQTWLIELSSRWTTLWITLNDFDVPPTSAAQIHAPLGHYCADGHPISQEHRTAGRLIHFGHVRRYKGIDSLLTAFAETTSSDLSLHILGETQDQGLRKEIQLAERNDPRVTWNNCFATQEQLIAEVLAAELAVLPFNEVTNSSSVIFALSFERPVLIPAGRLAQELSNEVGPRWVHTYEPPLLGSAIESTLELLMETWPEQSPNLASREWKRIGRLHAEAFFQAHRLARGTR